MKTLFMNLLAICTFCLLMVSVAHAQALVIDDFEDGDLSEYFQFSGGEGSVLSTTGTTPDGSTFALQFDTDGDDYGGFAGFGRPVPGAPYNTSGLDNPYLVFDLSANVPMTVEINLQTAGDAENRNALVLSGTGTYTRYALPFSSFFQSQANPFDPTMLNNVVFTVIGLAGDGDSGTTEATLRLDNVAIFEAGSVIMNDLVADDFEDGDLSEYGIFAGAEPPVLSTITATPDGSSFALRSEFDGDDYGGFAGFFRPFAGAPIDISSFDYLNFYLRANGPGVIEVNLQNDPTAVGGLKEGREAIRVEDTGGAYQLVSLPLDAFIQTTAQPFDPTAAFNIVFVAVQLPGDGDSGTTEFALDLDDIGFSEDALVPGPVVTADLAPTGSTVIPASGGTLGYAVTLTNTTNQAQTFAAQIDAILPNSSTFGPVQGPRTVTLAAGASVGPISFTSNVPANAPAGSYHLVLSLSMGGTEFTSDSFTFTKDAAASLASARGVTAETAYPNPAAERATIPFVVEAATQIRLAVYDVTGREVAVLVDGTVQAGRHEARFDRGDLPSGVYLWRLSTGTQMQTGRLTLVR